MIKVTRTYPAPESLAEEAKKPGASGRYDREDVVEQLRTDFHDKCYICGMNKLQDPQIEHRLPHKNGAYLERKFDWNNLFLSCGHCNSVKNRSIYDDGILDCCKADPEQSLVFHLHEDQVEVKTVNQTDENASLTARLMQEVFSIRNTGMRVYKSEMRVQELTKEMNLLYGTLGSWKRNPESCVIQKKLKAILRRESRFAEFKRCYVREHAKEYGELMRYIA